MLGVKDAQTPISKGGAAQVMTCAAGAERKVMRGWEKQGMACAEPDPPSAEGDQTVDWRVCREHKGRDGKHRRLEMLPTFLLWLLEAGRH